MTAKPPKRPRDPNQLAKAIVDLATMDDDERQELTKRLPAKPSQSPGKRGSTGSKDK